MAVHVSPQFSWSTAETDANLRATMNVLCDAMDAVGFVRTSDSGQFDPDTVLFADLTQGGGNVYEVRYLDDSLHATAPILARIDWYYVNNYPYKWMRFKIGFCSATDGAGAIVGASYTFDDVNVTLGAAASVHATAGDGYAGLYVPVAGGPFWYVARSADITGTPTGDGYQVYGNGDTMPGGVSSNIGTADYRADIDQFTGFPLPNYTFIPGGRTSSANPGTAMDVYRHWSALPTPMVNPFAVTVHASEHQLGTTFTTDPVQDDVHTFMPWTLLTGADATNVNAAGVSRNGCLAVRWEE